MLYEELSYSTLGAALEVHRTLGPGFLEVVYQKALAHELFLRHIPFEQQVPVRISYKETEIGEYRADFVIADKIILEIKAVSALNSAHESQAHHYLAATGLRLAILLNFGARSLMIKRVIK